MILILSASCGRKEGAVSPAENSTADTITALPDTVEIDSIELAEEAPPEAVDELFDDFVYAFMRNRKFQKSRIAFPLPVNKEGKDSVIRRKDWTFDPVYAEQEFYTMLFNDKAAMEAERDASVNHVTVEWVDLDNCKVKEYLFNRSSGVWKLSSLSIYPLADNANGSFYGFYQQFAADSLYQREHIAKQLAFNTYDEENFEDITGVLDVEQWFAFRPTLPLPILTNIIYGERPADNAERYFVIGSLSGGMSCTLHFKRDGNDWQLVGYDN